MSDLSPTILLVEDNSDDSDMLRREFRKANLVNPVQIVTDGREAIDYFRGTGRFSDRAKYPLPFLVFLDLRLPRCDGLEVLTWIKGQPALQEVALVVLSSSDNGLDYSKAFALGARWHLRKPPMPGDLERLLAAVGGGYWRRSADRDPGPGHKP
ncbi:MAG TPA: response regulator [Opitutaceae bacterium]|nr:response regulator [Opitutaceae bacterium]